MAVTGSPRLTIDMDPAHWGAKRTAYESGSGTTALVFAHTVVEPNISTRGIAVLANRLALDGGTIRSAATQAATQADARLAHGGLGHDPAHKVDWRPALSVADAEAHEGTDAAVEFEVTVKRAPSSTVTVDHATADRTATAGEDYTATSGTLTFAAGERSKTVSVPLIDDAFEESRETFVFRLTNAQGARIEDGDEDQQFGEAVGSESLQVPGVQRTSGCHWFSGDAMRRAGPTLMRRPIGPIGLAAMVGVAVGRIGARRIEQ